MSGLSSAISTAGTSHNEESYVKTQSRADMLGEQCEFKMAELVYLRVLDTAQDFHLASNMHGTGAFDDLVLRVRYKNEVGEVKCVTCFIQLKHKKKDQYKVTQTMLLSTNPKKNDFSLLKYFESYCIIEDSFNELITTNPVICDKFSDCFFVLFTNASVPHKSQMMDAQFNTYIRNIIQTGSDNAFLYSDIDEEIWQPRQEKLERYPALHKITNNLDRYHTFLKKFIIFEQQANVSELDNIIKEEISYKCGTSEENTDKIFSFLNNKLQDWWQNQNFFLTKFTRYWQESVDHHLVDLNAPVVLSLRHCCAVFDEKCCDDFLKGCVSTPGVTSVVVKDIEPNLRFLKIYQTLRRQFSQSFILMRISDVQQCLGELLCAWKHKLCQVICIDTEDCLEKTLSFLSELTNLSFDNAPKLIVMSGGKMDNFTTVVKYMFKQFAEYKDIWTIDQFEKQSQQFIFSKNVMFQGHEVSLESLVNRNVRLKQELNGTLLSYLLYQKTALHIGDKLESELELYIPRTLGHSILIKEDIFKETGENDVIVVGGMTQEELNRLTYDRETDKTFHPLVHENTKCCLSADSLLMPDMTTDEEMFKEVVSKYRNKNIHWLVKENTSYKWLQSVGETTIISRNTEAIFPDCKFDGHCLCLHSEKTLFEYYGKCVLIVGEPGIGKSSLLHNIAHKGKLETSSSWIIQVNLNDLSNVLYETENWALETVISLLCDIVTTSNSPSCVGFVKLLLEESLLHTGNVIVLLDGVDEISPMYTQQVLQIVNILMATKVSKLVISSRSLMQKELEESLQCRSLTIQHFNQNDQLNYLQSFYKIKCKNNIPMHDDDLNSFVECVMKHAGNNFFIYNGNSFTSIPIHLMMLAEIISPNDASSKNYGISSKFLNLSELYRIFINLKRDIYYKKFPLILSKSANTGVKCREDQYFLEHHMMCALVVMLSPIELAALHDKTVCEKVCSFLNNFSIEKTGLITEAINGKPSFVHFTYCEYLTALWFQQHYKENREILSHILFQPRFQFVRYLFDQILSTGLTLHETIPGGNVEVFYKFVDSYDLNSVDSGGRTCLHLAASYNNKYFAITLICKGIDVNIKDDVFQWNTLQYAERVHAWDMVNRLLSSGCDPEDLLTLKNNSDNETFLQNVLAKAVSTYCDTLIKVILKNKYDVNRTFLFDNWREHLTLLHLSVRYRNFELVKYILEETNANVHVCDSKNNTPLHYAVCFNEMLIASYLIEAGSDINSMGFNGITPLHLSAYVGNSEMTHLLLGKGSSHDAITSVVQLVDETMDDIVRVSVKPWNCFTNSICCSDIAQISTKGTTALHWAAWKGHTCVASALLEQGADINKHCKHSTAYTPLSFAVLDENTYMIHFLLDKGADINLEIKNGYTCLHLAAEEGNTDITSLLLDRGAEINRPAGGTYGYTPLHVATINKHTNIMKLLLDKGADVNLVTLDDTTALHLASYRGHIDAANILLDAGSDVNKAAKNCNGVTPLLAAVLSGNVDFVSLLSKEGACINLSSQDGTSPLHAAAYRGDADMALTLLEAGADVNKRAQLCNGATPLHAAVLSGNVNLTTLLLHNGADINLTDFEGYNCLHLAVKQNHIDVTNTLLDFGTNINIPDEGETKITPLHASVISGNIHMTTLLLDRGATVNSVSCDGATPLYFAAELSNVDVVAVLLDRGAALTCLANNGLTPLHCAVRNGSASITSMLLKRGADINMVSNVCASPLQYAVHLGHVDIISILIDVGAKVNIPPGDVSPLHIAVLNQNKVIISLLLDKGADIRAVTNVAKLLEFVQGQIDVALTDKINKRVENKITPLQIATLMESDDIIQFLLNRGAN